MANQKLIDELYDQIMTWQAEIDRLDDMIDKAYWRIDMEKGNETEVDMREKLRLVFSKE